MKGLTIKNGILLFLCVGALYQAYETDAWNFAMLLFLLSIILGCYFLVPVFKRKSIPVLFILILLEMMQFVVERELTGYLVLLLFYFTMELGTYMSTNLYRMIVCLFVLMNVGIGIIVFSYTSFIWICLFLLISYLLIHLNNLDEDYQQIRETYESLLNDYRIQKDNPIIMNMQQEWRKGISLLEKCMIPSAIS